VLISAMVAAVDDAVHAAVGQLMAVHAAVAQDAARHVQLM
jgi:hypothetical protein